MLVRIRVRGWENKEKKFDEHIELESAAEINKRLPVIAQHHISMLADAKDWLVEIEFLDEPDPLQRFFRLGSHPTHMAVPIILNRREEMN
jgi:hypothetical protein